MILHQGDRYVCNGTQVHPGSLNFLKSSLEIGVIHIFTQTKNFFPPHHGGLFSCKTLHMVFRNPLNVQHVEYSHIFAI